jgi:hypothetical protein
MDMDLAIKNIIARSTGEEDALKQFYEWYTVDKGDREFYADRIRHYFAHLKRKAIVHVRRHTSTVIKSSKNKFPSNKIPPKKKRK